MPHLGKVSVTHVDIHARHQPPELATPRGSAPSGPSRRRARVSRFHVREKEMRGVVFLRATRKRRRFYDCGQHDEGW